MNPLLEIKYLENKKEEVWKLVEAYPHNHPIRDSAVNLYDDIISQILQLKTEGALS